MLKYYNGHKITHENHYDSIYLPTHHSAKKNGQVYIHILQAEKLLKRDLKKGEVVHHIDNNKLNNNLDNLMIFANSKHHASYHKALNENLDYELKRIEGVYFCQILTTSKYSNICPICGNKKEKKSLLCMTCRINKRRQNIPPRNDLIKLLMDEVTIMDIGRKYNVRDNSVRKWLIHYQLPYKKNDIEIYRKERLLKYGQ